MKDKKINLKDLRHGTELLKRGFAKMQKGGVIMDVTNAEQAVIAEKAGAVAVMALYAVPSDIRKVGGVARMADPKIIREIMDAVTIPVMAKARIGHYVEAQILEALGVDMIDESEVLTPAADHHIYKKGFTVPFVCGARDLGEALRRIDEGAAMIRTKGEAGTGDVAEAVRHSELINREIIELGDGFYNAGNSKKEKEEKLKKMAEEYRIKNDVNILYETAKRGRLPVVNFAAGGIATPADAALMMHLGADGVFVGSAIFTAENPKKMAKAIVKAVADYDNPAELAKISYGLGQLMKGIAAGTLKEEDKIQYRGK